jgi:hypothetical protein
LRKEVTVGRSSRRRAEGNAGAFLGPDVLIPVPMRPLPPEDHDPPTEPDDPDPEPVPGARGLIRRLLDRLSARPDRR